MAVSKQMANKEKDEVRGGDMRTAEGQANIFEEYQHL